MKFRPIYEWFRDTLEMVAPDSRFEPFERFLQEDHLLYGTMNDLLRKLDTGILYLGGEEIPFENIPLPELIKSTLQEELTEGKTLRWLSAPMNERFVVSRKDGELTAKKLVAYHRKVDGGEAKFEMRYESDGSQRIIDLLPAFLELTAAIQNKVFVIDEIDRSLHTLLTRQLIESFLETCTPVTRSQLLFTTHDVLLMDQSLLRRDEMWITERAFDGASSIFSLSDYKDVRYDKDIRKSYLQGRLGGVPRIFLTGPLAKAAD